MWPVRAFVPVNIGSALLAVTAPKAAKLTLGYGLSIPQRCGFPAERHLERKRHLLPLKEDLCFRPIQVYIQTNLLTMEPV